MPVYSLHILSFYHFIFPSFLIFAFNYSLINSTYTNPLPFLPLALFFYFSAVFPSPLPFLPVYLFSPSRPQLILLLFNFMPAPSHFLILLFPQLILLLFHFMPVPSITNFPYLFSYYLPLYARPLPSPFLIIIFLHCIPAPLSCFSQFKISNVGLFLSTSLLPHPIMLPSLFLPLLLAMFNIVIHILWENSGSVSSISLSLGTR